MSLIFLQIELILYEYEKLFSRSQSQSQYFFTIILRFIVSSRKTIDYFSWKRVQNTGQLLLVWLRIDWKSHIFKLVTQFFVLETTRST